MGKIVRAAAKPSIWFDPRDVDASPNTPEEDAEIRRQIAEDPDTWEFTGDIVDRPPPHKRGRPAGRTKAQVTVSLDIELIEALKSPDAKGWQTRLNAAARAGLKI